jgi:hypothetical protein
MRLATTRAQHAKIAPAANVARLVAELPRLLSISAHRFLEG